jgi:tryptophan synthase alpha chain
MKIGIYFTIGDLGLKNSLAIFKGLLDGQIDLLEIGLPFSDPLLDGTTIQESHARAVKENISWEEICNALSDLKKMCNLNQQISVMTTSQHLYDINRRSKLPTLDGILISDIRHNIQNPFPVSTKRVWFLNQEIALKKDNLFPPEEISMIYLTRVQGTTGENQKNELSTEMAISSLKNISNKEIWLGFGISNQKDVLEAKNQGASGVIIGSAFVKKITDYYFNHLSEYDESQKINSLYHFSKNYISELRFNLY